MYLKFVTRILIFFAINAFSTAVQSQEKICEDGTELLVTSPFCMGEDCPPPILGCKTGIRILTTERATYEKILKSNDQLMQMNNHLTAISNSLASVPSMAQTSQETKNLLNNTITNFNKELRSSINSRFDQLPQELAASEVMKKLKEDILLEVDKKINAK